MNDWFADVLGAFFEPLLDPSDSAETPTQTARVPRLSDRYAAKGQTRLPGTIIDADGKLSGRFIVTLSAGDVVRVHSLSTTGSRALLIIEKASPSAADLGYPPAKSGQHAIVATYETLERRFDLLRQSSEVHRK